MIMNEDENEWIDDFINMYFSYDAIDIHQGFALKDQYIPKKLYRYRPLSNGKEDRTFQEIASQTVCLSRANKLNDPFDCVGYCDIEKAVEILPQHRIDGFISVFDSYEETQRIPREELLRGLKGDNWFVNIQKLINKYCPEDWKPIIYDVFLGWKTMFETEAFNIGRIAKERMALCSFTESNTNMPMWNFYADEYRGVCIEYNMDLLPKGSAYRRMMFPVLYADDLFNVTKYTSISPRSAIHDLGVRIAIQKHTDWQYEKEWRIAADLEKCQEETEGRFDQTISFPFISAIYMGKEINDMHEKRLQAISQEMRIPLSKMALGLKGVEFTEKL